MQVERDMEISPSRLRFELSSEVPFCCFTVRNNCKHTSRAFKLRSLMDGTTFKPSGGLLNAGESIGIIARLEPRKRKDLIIREEFASKTEPFILESVTAGQAFVMEYELLTSQAKAKKAMLRELWQERYEGFFQLQFGATFVPPKIVELKLKQNFLSALRPRRTIRCYKPLYLDPPSGLVFNVSSYSCHGKYVSQTLSLTNNSKDFMAYKFELPNSVLQAGELEIEPAQDVIAPGQTKSVKLRLMLQVGIGHILGHDRLIVTSTTIQHEILIDQLKNQSGKRLESHKKTILECIWNHAGKNDLWVDGIECQIHADGYENNEVISGTGKLRKPSQVSVCTRFVYFLRKMGHIPMHRHL